ncbi:hypothetical protein DFH09DRAFT_1073082 [Mycena vulgaris]|nr:hypothetical protein DFH09DRAFT_1073082 [Mycena vulgaris]
MPTLRSGVAPAVGLSLVRQHGPKKQITPSSMQQRSFRVDARGGREVQADMQRVHCFKSDRIYEKEREANGQEYPREKPATPDMQSGEDDEGPADSPTVCKGGGRSSRVEPAREDQDTANIVRGILIESKQQPDFYIQLAAVHRSAAQWERYPLVGNSGGPWNLPLFLDRPNLDEFRSLADRIQREIADTPQSVLHSTALKAGRSMSQCNCGQSVKMGHMGMLLGSAALKSFDVEEEGRGERGVEGDMLDGD